MTPERYKELADAAVRVGVLKRYPCERNWWIYAIVDGEPGGKVAREIITDWRVVGALMEKVAAAGNLEILVCAIEGSDNEIAITELTPSDNPLERESLIANETDECLKLAIAEACIKSLGAIE